MYYINTIFDCRRPMPKPLYVAMYETETKLVEHFPVFSGTGTPLLQAIDNWNRVKEIMNNNQVVVASSKPYLKSLKLNPNRLLDIYDANVELPPPTTNLAKDSIVGLQALLKYKPAKWQKLITNANFVYSHLEDNGYYHNHQKCYPRYEYAFSGRSKCLENNIQGASNADIIHHSEYEYNKFVCFDWIAADFRVVSLLSKDKTMQDSYKESDPYTHLHQLLGEDFTRNQCKLELFKSLYSMDYESPVLEVYPRFADWVRVGMLEAETSHTSYSILDRKFVGNNERTSKSVFNAKVQGSVAHAMQHVLHMVYREFPNNILTEIHDSLVMCGSEDDIDRLVTRVSEIMLHPFVNLLPDNPRFPLKVSMGTDWRMWSVYKELR